MRKLGYMGIVLILVVLVILPAKPSTTSLARSRHVSFQAANVMILLNGFVSAWNSSTNPNPTITVHPGDTVTISLVSSDGAPHQFLLDIDKDGSTTATCPTIDPCSATFPPNTTFSFTAGRSGTYTYYCTVHPTSMFGTFVILDIPATGGRHPYQM